jgi:HEAT repeat protein
MSRHGDPAAPGARGEGAGGAGIDFAAIQRTQDRSWTARLLAAMRDASSASYDDLIETIERLEDPRAVAPLTELVEDAEAAARCRAAAGAILRSWGNPPTSEQVRRWWGSGDEILQRHALLLATLVEEDLVVAVARDPAHPLHEDGIATMVFGFEAPRFQALKIAALGHADPAVRKTAAEVLHWDEPVAAEAPLLRLLGDAAPDVAVAAVKTLRYYPTRQTVSALAGLFAHPHEELGCEAHDAVAELRGTFKHELRALRGGARARLWAWADPVCDILELFEEDLEPPARGPEAPRAEPSPGAAAAAPSVDELVRLYEDPDGSWRDKKDRFYTVRGEAYVGAERRRLIELFAGHPDPDLRQRCASLLAEWGEPAELVRLLADPAFLVRKSAMYWLGQTAANAALAEPIWEHLHRAGTTSTHASESLRSYVTHARRDEAVPRLVALARGDERESVRYHAIEALVRLGARGEVQGLLPLLAEPPAMTWSLHLALLRGCSELGLAAAHVDGLREVDNVYVQAALCKLEA